MPGDEGTTGGWLILGATILIFESGTLLAEGTQAPAFNGKLSDGGAVSLLEYRGKKNVVVFFYPKDFTSGCTREVCSLRDNYANLLRYEVVLLGISFDDNRSHQSFIQQHHLPFPLISDEDQSIARAYGAAGRLGGFIPGAKRVTYVIDKAGIIRAVIHHELLVGKHVEGILDALEKIQDSGNT